MQTDSASDAMLIRLIRDHVRILYGNANPLYLLIIVLHLINPSCVHTMLVQMRDNLEGKTNEQLNKLIAELAN